MHERLTRRHDRLDPAAHDTLGDDGQGLRVKEQSQYVVDVDRIRRQMAFLRPIHLVWSQKSSATPRVRSKE